MNIVFLLQDTGSVYGAERATLDLAVGLREAGRHPRFLLLEETRLALPSSRLRESIEVAGFRCDTVPVAARFSLQVINRIHQNLADAGADVLHTVGYKADVHGGLAAQWGREWPVVSTVHGWLFRPDVKERFYGWLNLHALRRCSRVVALSRHYESFLLEKGVSPERLVRISSGLDPEAISPMTEPAGTFTVGIMGRLSSEKNHSMFLRAARRILDNGTVARFLIAGEGPERAAIERHMSALGLTNAVELTGFADRLDVLRRVHVVVMTSRMENLPYTVLEAMSAGRPVVATRVGGLPDLVDDRVSGFLVPSDDDAALAARIGQLARDAGLRERMAGMSRYKLESEFARSDMIARHAELYASLVA